MSALSSDELALLRRIRDTAHALAKMCQEANGRGVAVAFNINVPEGTVDMKFTRAVPVSIDEG